MKKALIKTIFFLSLTFMMGLSLNVQSQNPGPPPPPGGSSGSTNNNGNRNGGGAPIGGGLLILLGMGGTYGGYKMYQKKKNSLLG